jgi:pseudouridylate synthase / pseudouridine kinase
VGATAVDITSHADPFTTELISKSTVPGQVSISLGGVARNMAEAAHRSLSLSPTSSHSSVPSESSHSPTTLLVSPLGQDMFGTLIQEQTASMGMRTDGFLHTDARKSLVCNMVLSEDGGLVGGVADFSALSTFGSGEVSSVCIYSWLWILVKLTGVFKDPWSVISPSA